MSATPYLNLRLGHPQSVRQLRPFRTGQILGLLKGFLQGEDLLSAEGGPGVLLLAVLVLVVMRLR